MTISENSFLKFFKLKKKLYFFYSKPERQSYEYSFPMFTKMFNSLLYFGSCADREAVVGASSRNVQQTRVDQSRAHSLGD